MNFISNYSNSFFELISNHLDKLELFILSNFIVLLIFNAFYYQILVKKIMDESDYLITKHQVAYKEIRYYSLKIITLIDFLPLIWLVAYEFIKHSENILKYSPFFGLI